MSYKKKFNNSEESFLRLSGEEVICVKTADNGVC